ncbi:hypothetical protein JT305_01260 [Salmonella enterica subsp. enterica serovar Senftenberg]|nr:hypothetical protein [Salmonella enterica subsp. enterica serovar Senftenberg]
MRNTQGFLLLTLMYTLLYTLLHAFTLTFLRPDSRILSTIVINLSLCWEHDAPPRG